MATIVQLLQAARHHHEAGRLAEAESLYRQVLKLDPRQPDARHQLGVLAHGVGRFDLTLEFIGEAIALDPARARYHFDLGEAYRALGRLSEAQASYERAVQIGPDDPSALNNLGTLLLLQGNPAEAQRFLERAVRVKPDYAFGHNNLGSVWMKLGRFAEAQACFERALKCKPHFAMAHYNLGAVFHKNGRLLEAEVQLRESVRLNPGYAPAQYQLGAVLKDAVQLTEAQAALEQALQLEPAFVDALTLLANVLGLQARTSEARAALDRALAIQPSAALQVRSALLLPVLYESVGQLEQERSRIDASLARLSIEVLTIEDPVGDVGTTLFFLAYQGKNDRDLHTRLAGLYRRAAPALDYVAPHCQVSASTAAARRPIRVGMLSAFFYRHTIGKLTLGFVRNLSREHFTLTLFRFPGPDDFLARSLEQSADRVITLPRNMDVARQQIADEHLDVLYYPEIGMDPWTYFLAFARLAPVQCVAWGHPVTTGIPTIDYFLSSHDLEPADAGDHYSEVLVRLSKINTYYYEPSIEGPVKDRAALGLPEDATVYVCPQSLFKIHPEFDAVLGQILSGDPRAQVVLIEGICEQWKQFLADRFRRSFPAEADRVVSLPRLSQEDFLHLQARADVLLDTSPFGGGNTSYEAFAFGTPIVTRTGKLLRNRITYACYRQMGVPDCIAETAEDYVRIALRLGTDSGWRDDVRCRILAKKHLLYEDQDAVWELEQFLLGAVDRVRTAVTV